MGGTQVRFKKLSRFCMVSTLVLFNHASYAKTTDELTQKNPAENKSWTESNGLLDAAGVNPNESSLMKKLGLTVGGWLETSVSTQLNSSRDNFNGPVTFNDRSDELQLNQTYIWLQKPITVSADAFDIGGRFDFMYGTDAIFTQAYGVLAGPGIDRGHWDLHLSSHKNNRFYGIALPQAYLEFNLPFGNGIDLKVGHFYSPVGYEVVTAPDNFFITKSTTFTYGEPFTHTGILGSYTFNPNWNIKLGTVTGSSSGGWDGSWDQQLGNWAFLGGATWTSNDAQTTLTITSTAGRESETKHDLWALYSIVGTHNFTDKLHYVIQHDHGFADNMLTPFGAKYHPDKTQDVQWYGINQYLFYDLDEKLSVGLRAEWFRDQNGARIYDQIRCGSGANSSGPDTMVSYTCTTNAPPNPGGHFYTVTAGLKYKPLKWLSLRPNIRYDYATIPAFNFGHRKDQILFTADMVMSF